MIGTDLETMAAEAAQSMFGSSPLSEPSVSGQFNERDDSWELADWMVKVYDMSSPERLKEYEELLSLASQEDPSVVILEQDKQFCPNSENWKVFITCALVRYKNILDK